MTNIDNVTFCDAVTCSPEECLALLPTSNSTISVLSQNIRSIKANFSGLLTLIERINKPCDVIVLSECWLSSDPIIPVLDGYNHYRSLITHNQNDGVVVYVNSTLLKVKVTEPDLSDSSSLLITVGADLAIIAVYRPYAFKDVSKFIQSLDCLLTKLKSYKNIVLVGDLNVDIGHSYSAPHSLDYIDVLAHHGLFLGHTFPTHGSTCLDHSNLKTVLPSKILVIQSTVTDHFATLVALTFKKVTIRGRGSIIKIDEDKLSRDLLKINFEPVFAADEPNSATNLLIEPITHAISMNSTVLKLSCRKRPIKPWITPGILKCMRHRDNLYKQLKKEPRNEILLISYKRYRNFCINLLRKVKRDYEKLEFKKAGNDTKKVWNVIQSVTNTNKAKSSADDLLDTKRDIQHCMNGVNTYFAEVGRQLADKIDSNLTVDNCPSHTDFQTQSFVLLNTDESEVERLIMSLKNKSATGWDGISSEFLKLHKNIIVPPLTHICNLSINTGVFPDAFKKAIIHPIFKCGDRTYVENYRPISVLPAMSKVLEKIINIRFVNYLESYSLLSFNQFGFRKNRSTDDAVHSLVNHIVGKLDGGQRCVALFLDLTKAFDTVSIPILLSRLESLGIRGNQLCLFRRYLTGRSQCVKIGTHRSPYTTIEYGVPQGSILGPSLFLAYINDLCDLKLDHGTIFAYADDTALVFCSKTLAETYRLAQKGFDTVSGWLSKNLLTLNIGKTKLLNFTIRESALSLNLSLRVVAKQTDSLTDISTYHTIENVSCIRYLGIVLDRNLTFKAHIESLSSRVRKLIYIFKQLRQSADPNVMKMVYQALCQSILSYCITTWGGAAKTHLIILERAQRAVLKVCCFKPRLYPTRALYEYCQVLTVRQLFIQATTMKQHSLTQYTLNTTRRNHLVAPSTSVRTSFSRRFFVFLGPYLYNKIHKIVSVFNLNIHNCKIVLHEWLLKQTYSSTENLLVILV